MRRKPQAKAWSISSRLKRAVDAGAARGGREIGAADLERAMRGRDMEIAGHADQHAAGEGRNGTRPAASISASKAGSNAAPP